MNRYPLWKYLTVLAALLIGILYTLPNFFGESPAVQVAGAKASVRIEPALLDQVENTLTSEGISTTGGFYEQNGPVGTIKVRFDSTDEQLRAKDIIEQSLNDAPESPDYTVALNLLPAAPNWMSAIGAEPMHLGLDLRGGVHFLLQVDMRGALTGRYDTMTGEFRNILRDAGIQDAGIERSDLSVVAAFDSETDRDDAHTALRRALPDMTFSTSHSGGQYLLSAVMSDATVTQVQTNALKQNITTLHNRINELGVAEPVIQQQGADRIIVQLPGVQDVAKAKEILGRTATLEIRMVDDSPSAQSALNSGKVPFGLERYEDTDGRPLLLRRQ